MYLFPFVFIAAMAFTFFLKSRERNDSASIEAFWEREAKANATPKKDIDTLNYITLSTNALPFLSNPSKTIEECEKTIRILADKKILNLNGISNTELKLQYGAANLTRLSQYDENYSIMHRTLTKWGRELFNEGYDTEAIQVLEYALELGCDARNIYLTLRDLYNRNSIDRIDWLILSLSASNTPLKESILKELKTQPDKPTPTA